MCACVGGLHKETKVKVALPFGRPYSLLRAVGWEARKGAVCASFLAVGTQI